MPRSIVKYSPLNGILVHHRVNPQQYVTGRFFVFQFTHAGEEGQSGVKFLVYGHTRSTMGVRNKGLTVDSMSNSLFTSQSKEVVTCKEILTIYHKSLEAFIPCSASKSHLKIPVC